MSVVIGSRLGSYEILSPIGAGGMGEVYRARDTKLGRDVAIKVLPEEFARDAGRMARFQREAKLLASLDHPNIAAIHGLEDSDGTRALVMQLAEGPTLADRIKAGPIPIDEALPIARQICDALEYAHERGIVHRDLKPGNVKVSADDTVKILDFGLAKALEGGAASADSAHFSGFLHRMEDLLEAETASANVANSPTLSQMATQAGILLGTAAYMSPEQAKGKAVDRRADIWAFGCVLYEMLAGKMAFGGEAVTDTLAAVIKSEPDWSLLPATTPPHIRVLLRRCLQKDPKQRLQAIGDARIALEEVLTGSLPSPAVAAPSWRHAVPWAVAIVAVLATLALAAVQFREKPTALVEPVRFQIPAPDSNGAIGGAGLFELSPDGRQLAFVAVNANGGQQIWIRSLDSLEARPLPSAEGPFDVSAIIWSPDSRYIAFDTGGKAKKIPISGGPAEDLCDWKDIFNGGSWNRDGVIIFGGTGGGLMQVSAAGGTPSPLTVPDSASVLDHHSHPWFLSDGRHFIYYRGGSVEKAGIYVGSLDVKPKDQNLARLIATEFVAKYVPSSNPREPGRGHILFVRDGTLMAQAFDERRLELVGEPIAIADKIATIFEAAGFSVSGNGVLVYQTGVSGRFRQLEWLNRQGKVLGAAGEPAMTFTSVELSPDGARAAVGPSYTLTQPLALWLLDFARGTSTRFTFGSSSAAYAIWSPDGRQVVFASNREGHLDLYRKPANSATDEELLLNSDEDKQPTSWSRDGRFLLYTVSRPKSKSQVWVFPLGADKKPFPFVHTEFNENDGQFSPDGRWVAYSSDESGRLEIYVRPFSPTATTARSEGKWLISNNGGGLPRWRGDGKELYYLVRDGTLMAVGVNTSPAFRVDVPKSLFRVPLGAAYFTSSAWDVTADGKRFLFSGLAAQSQQTSFTVVLNWQAALKK